MDVAEKLTSVPRGDSPNVEIVVQRVWPASVMAGNVRQFVLLFLMWTVAACGASGAAPPGDQGEMMAKVRFDVAMLDEQGLYGPADGLRALSYEFCIPARQQAVDEVRTIDPTVQIYRGSRGRIGCTSDQFLSIGSTHQHEFRTVLTRLAQLDYVTRIDPSYGE